MLLAEDELWPEATVRQKQSPPLDWPQEGLKTQPLLAPGNADGRLSPVTTPFVWV
jgi:hypothetical protein